MSVKKSISKRISVKKHLLQLPDEVVSQCYVFSTGTDSPVTAIIIGSVENVEKPLVRMHSRCMYGEVFQSLDCDCYGQLDLALKLMLKEQGGIFFYLEQEGRGSGLTSKASAYALKEQDGLDTVEAYHLLGLKIDNRSYRAVADALKYLEITNIRLLTNNPLKIDALSRDGISTERAPLQTKPTKENIDYLRVKQFKLGHDLGL